MLNQYDINVMVCAILKKHFDGKLILNKDDFKEVVRDRDYLFTEVRYEPNEFDVITLTLKEVGKP